MIITAAKEEVRFRSPYKEEEVGMDGQNEQKQDFHPPKADDCKVTSRT